MNIIKSFHPLRIFFKLIALDLISNLNNLWIDSLLTLFFLSTFRFKFNPEVIERIFSWKPHFQRISYILRTHSFWRFKLCYFQIWNSQKKKKKKKIQSKFSNYFSFLLKATLRDSDIKDYNKTIRFL
jgi:hypothetical protein